MGKMKSPGNFGIDPERFFVVSRSQGRIRRVFGKEHFQEDQEADVNL